MDAESITAQTKGHQWQTYDEHHRACSRCGLRLFWTNQGTYGNWGRGAWLLLDWRGVPSPPLLSSSGGGFGACVPAPHGEPVLIEYTGDPDVHPGCERVMHRAPEASGGSALMDLSALRPACGAYFHWWELGPSRKWSGWNWCQDCFPGREPRHVRPAVAERPAYTEPLPAPAPALKPKPKKRKRLPKAAG